MNFQHHAKTLQNYIYMLEKQPDNCGFYLSSSFLLEIERAGGKKGRKEEVEKCIGESSDLGVQQVWVQFLLH